MTNNSPRETSDPSRTENKGLEDDLNTLESAKTLAQYSMGDGHQRWHLL